MRSRENPLRRVSEHDVNVAIRRTHTASIYVHGPWAPESRDERRETRRDAANRIPRVSRLRLDVNHASSGPTHAYVSLKRPVSHSSRRASLQSECSSRLRPQFGRNFAGRILTLFFSSAKATRRDAAPFYQRPAKAGLPPAHAFLILDIHVWRTRHYAHWWWFPTAYAR